MCILLGLGSSFGDLLSGISLSGGNLGLGGGSVADPFGISGSVGGDLFPSGPVPVDVGSLAGGSNPGMAGKWLAELQIRRGSSGNLETIFLITERRYMLWPLIRTIWMRKF